jgi:hypothetical protein
MELKIKISEKKKLHLAFEYNVIINILYNTPGFFREYSFLEKHLRILEV